MNAHVALDVHRREERHLKGTWAHLGTRLNHRLKGIQKYVNKSPQGGGSGVCVENELRVSLSMGSKSIDISMHFQWFWGGTQRGFAENEPRVSHSIGSKSIDISIHVQFSIYFQYMPICFFIFLYISSFSRYFHHLPYCSIYFYMCVYVFISFLYIP